MDGLHSQVTVVIRGESKRNKGELTMDDGIDLTAKQREAMTDLVYMIHPKLNTVTDLMHCIRLITTARKELKLADKQDEKLANILIDLYAVIKDTAETYNMPSGLMSSFDEVLRGWNS